MIPLLSIVRTELGQDMAQAILAEEDQSRQAFGFHGAYPPLGECVQIRRSWRKFDGLHSNLRRAGQVRLLGLIAQPVLARGR